MAAPVHIDRLVLNVPQLDRISAYRLAELVAHRLARHDGRLDADRLAGSARRGRPVTVGARRPGETLGELADRVVAELIRQGNGVS